jgi:GNAT superfamily N-acetyltransferase
MPKRISRSSCYEIPEAINVFVRGFCETKSRTWPYEYSQINGVWVLRDAERKQAKDYRKEEWIAWNQPAEKVHETARSATRGRYFLCPVIGNDDSAEELKTAYKKLGYRLLSTEPLFVHNLKRIPKSTSNVTIQLMRTEEHAIAYGKFSKTRPVPTEALTSESFRQYLAWQNDEVVGCVRSVETPFGNWCSNLFVTPTHRRRGVARSLLSQLLREDRKRGARCNVLLSTHTGALVYPSLGYQQIGTLFIFAPKNVAGLRIDTNVQIFSKNQE